MPTITMVFLRTASPVVLIGLVVRDKLRAETESFLKFALRMRPMLNAP
jgi:hypothetical protein